MALDKGAQAVIFDVSDDANAAAEVSLLKLYHKVKNGGVKDEPSSLVL